MRERLRVAEELAAQNSAAATIVSELISGGHAKQNSQTSILIGFKDGDRQFGVASQPAVEQQIEQVALMEESENTEQL